MKQRRASAGVSWCHNSTHVGRVFSIGLLLATVSVAGVAGAQDEAAPAQAAPAPVLQQSPSTTTTTTTTSQYGFPDPGTDLESHLGSSSRSLSDIHSPDSFDLNSAGARQVATLRGNANAPGVTMEKARANTGIYVVRQGDTLSRISQQLYGQPWEWPKLWSLNAQIQNPHWIYPGDQIRLSAAGGLATKSRQSRTLGSGEALPMRSSMDPDTVFLRRFGYIDDPRKGVLGEVVGSREAIQLMAEGNSIYVILKPGTSVVKGQLLSIFRETRNPPAPRGARRPPGKVVAVKGTLRVEYFNPKTRVVRGEIIESLDIIERGAKVGLVERRFRIVPPVRTTKNLTSRILTSLYPHQIMGRHQVVFIDRGAKDGLQAGNRLFVIRRGDTWRRTLDSSSTDAQSRLLLDVPGSLQIEATPLHGDEQSFPEEVVGELRIVETHPFSSLAIVIEAKLELEPGDRAVARSGF